MKLTDIKKAHFVGVGGIGMSGLARLFLHEKKEVSGSDRASSQITEALEKEGVTFFGEQVAANISDDIDLVVYTEAMPHDHEELVAAREKDIATMNYFDALGMVANEYYLIAVAGSHGKTTTTAMLIDVLEEAGLDPTAIVGSLRSKTRSNFRTGKSKYFVVEACEYKRDFLSLEPDVLVITNLEHEHVDYYKTLEDVQSAFRELAEKVPEDGVVIVNAADQNVAPVVSGLSCEVVDYAKYVDPLLKLKQPGLHIVMDAAAALAAAAQVGIEKEVAQTALENFTGTWRRFEYKGKVNGAKVYDDYGHHPTEIKATIAGARELYPDKNIVVVFQPHTYTRTYELFDDFVRELAKADRVSLAPIYAAREENVHDVSSEKLAEEIGKENQNVVSYASFDEIVTELKDTLSEKDVLLVMGAGDVIKVSDLFFKKS